VQVDVDPKQCEANAIYVATAFDLFGLPDVSYVVVVMRSVVPGDELINRDAVRLCPDQALSIKENT
jgi:ferredoxin